jgi:hypothetical protein
MYEHADAKINFFLKKLKSNTQDIVLQMIMENTNPGCLENRHYYQTQKLTF